LWNAFIMHGPAAKRYLQCFVLLHCEGWPPYPHPPRWALEEVGFSLGCLGCGDVRLVYIPA
jgi:hypothetical protein